MLGKRGNRKIRKVGEHGIAITKGTRGRGRWDGLTKWSGLDWSWEERKRCGRWPGRSGEGQTGFKKERDLHTGDFTTRENLELEHTFHTAFHTHPSIHPSRKKIPQNIAAVKPARNR